jgi:hypothetical protein
VPEVKTWLETAGEPVADTCFPPGDVPPLPYVVFIDKIQRGGGDMRNLMKKHALTVERYSEDSGDNAALEALFDAGAIKYTKEKLWLQDPNDMFETIYDFNLIEREAIQNG